MGNSSETQFGKRDVDFTAATKPSKTRNMVIVGATAAVTLSACSSPQEQIPYEQWHKPEDVVRTVEQLPVMGELFIAESGVTKSSVDIRNYRFKVPLREIGGEAEVKHNPLRRIPGVFKPDALEKITFQPAKTGTEVTYDLRYAPDKTAVIAGDPVVEIDEQTSFIQVKTPKHAYTYDIKWKKNLDCKGTWDDNVMMTTHVPLDRADTELICNVTKKFRPFTSEGTSIFTKKSKGQSVDYYHSDKVVVSYPFEKQLGGPENRNVTLYHELAHSVYDNLVYAEGRPLEEIEKAFTAMEHIGGDDGKHPLWKAITESTYYHDIWGIENEYGHPVNKIPGQPATEAFASFTTVAANFPEQFLAKFQTLPSEEQKALAHFGQAALGIYENKIGISSKNKLATVFPSIQKLQSAFQKMA